MTEILWAVGFLAVCLGGMWFSAVTDPGGPVCGEDGFAAPIFLDPKEKT